MITLDEWGYPLLDPQAVPPSLERQARRAVSGCPALALRLTRMPDGHPGAGVRRVPRGAAPAAAPPNRDAA
jgi:hypothetical protein